MKVAIQSLFSMSVHRLILFAADRNSTRNEIRKRYQHEVQCPHLSQKWQSLYKLYFHILINIYIFLKFGLSYYDII